MTRRANAGPDAGPDAPETTEEQDLYVFPGDTTNPLYKVVSKDKDITVRIAGQSILLKKGKEYTMTTACERPLGKFLSVGVTISRKGK